jgi:pimeloyl-ACP methyl ester carboxylesterase
LAEHFRVYIPAHPGFALSEGLEQIEDIQDMAWHYVDLLDQLGFEHVPVVGFSLGAWIALETTLLRPQLFSKLVLVAAAGLHVEGAPMAELFIDDFDDLRRLLFFDAESSIVEQAMPLSLDDPRILMYLRAREATARVGWNPYLHDPKLSRHLHRIQTPTLVLWGREDKLVPLAHGEAYAKHLPNVRLEVFPHCGHMLPFEKPVDFAAQTVEFLRR